MILAEDEHVNKMIIVKSGVLEVFIHIDGNPMVLELLGSKSVLNHRNFLMTQELMFVNVRCRENAQVMILNQSDLMNFRSIFNQMFNKQYKLEQILPIDCSKYIRPSCEHNAFTSRMHARQLRLKNVVLQVIFTNRYERKKPTLFKVMQFLKKKGFIFQKDNSH